MSTWLLTGVDMTVGLAVTSCSRRVLVGLGIQSQSCMPLSVNVNDPSQAIVSCSQALPAYILPMYAGRVWLHETSQAPVALAWP